MDDPEFVYDLEGPFTPSLTRKKCSRATTRLWRSAKWRIRRAASRVGHFILGACFAVARIILLPWSKVFRLMFIAAEKWERAFALSCIAVCFDPLFFYIPIVHETNKCLKMDNSLRITALILRSLTDVLLVAHIISVIREKVHTDYPKYTLEDSESTDPHSESRPGSTSYAVDDEFVPNKDAMYPISVVKKKLPWLTLFIIIKFLAILPIPQVAILVGFYRIRGSDFFIVRKFLNVILVLQYLPRVSQIYINKSQFRMAGTWVKPSFNLFLYLLASHVLGALWYFFGIERETSCWHKACIKTAGCVDSTYSCSGNSNTSKIDIAVLNELCPISSPNSTLFDFGIFIDILQSGNTQSANFIPKLFYSFWWGLKNLSNFGTGLETSDYIWENCFAILICVNGLLLFLYLIGNVQLYIQSATQKSLDEETSRTKKIRNKRAAITNWMRNKFDERNRIRIKRAINEENVVEKNLSHVVDVKFFLEPRPSLTSRVRNPTLEHLGLAQLRKLRKVPMFEHMDDKKLATLSKSMKPVVYNNDDPHIAGWEKQLDMILFIIEGKIECTIPAHADNMQRLHVEDSFYGQEIIEWASFNYANKSYYDPLPSSAVQVKCRVKVEALGLKAWDLLRFIEANVEICSPTLKELADAYAHSHPKTDQIHTEAQTIIPPPPWKSPDPGSVKLNCSMLILDTKVRVGLGCILRGSKGEFIAARNIAVEAGIDEFENGALSIRKNLEYYCNKPQTSNSKIVVECENMLLIHCINNWSSSPSTSKGRVRQRLQPTFEAISKFKFCSFVACDPQSNKAALVVAQNTTNEPHSWKVADELPVWLLQATSADVAAAAAAKSNGQTASSSNAAGPVPKTSQVASVDDANDDSKTNQAAPMPRACYVNVPIN